MSSSSAAQERALAIGHSRAGRLVYRIVWRLLRMVAHPYFRVTDYGAEHLDTPGPLIVAPVHRSNLDAPLVASLGGRRYWALSKESLFANRILGWLVSALGAFPVARGAADRDALGSAVDLLAAGEAVLVFPEGTRQSGLTVGQVFDGAVYLAARTGAKIVPVGIVGTEAAMPAGARFPRRSRVTIVVGAPLDPPGDGSRLKLSQRRAASAQLAATLQSLLDQAASGQNMSISLQS